MDREPLWPIASVLGLRPAGFAFQKVCLEFGLDGDSFSSFLFNSYSAGIYFYPLSCYDIRLTLNSNWQILIYLWEIHDCHHKITKIHCDPRIYVFRGFSKQMKCNWTDNSSSQVYCKVGKLSRSFGRINAINHPITCWSKHIYRWSITPYMVWIIMSLYGVFGYHVTLWGSHDSQSPHIRKNLCPILWQLWFICHKIIHTI